MQSTLNDAPLTGLRWKRKAEEHMHSSHGDVDFAMASAELAKTIAKLRVIELTKKAM